MVIISHPTGNTFVRALVSHLQEAGCLQAFYTALHFGKDDLLVRFLPAGLRAELCRRSFEIPPEKLFCRSMRELTRLASDRTGLRLLTGHETGWASVDAVYRDLDRYVARQLLKRTSSPATCVFCYEDGALETFRAAKQIGAKCCYDLPIAYWETSRRILEEEAQRLPEWRNTLVGTDDSAQKLQRKSDELAAADTVVCPSSFVLESLPSDVRRNKKCIVAEFGTPEISAHSREHSRPQSAPLRVLFAGSMTQRKGLADVFAAFTQMNRKDVQLVVMGSPIAPLEFYRKQYESFVHEPTRPHVDVLALMRTCDVLVLPSLVEGRALVQQEAMACGLPIVVTFNAGGADLVEEGRTGFLVPIRSPEKIAEKLSWLASHRNDTREMGELAREKAANLTWRSYSTKILTVIQQSTSAENGI